MRGPDGECTCVHTLEQQEHVKEYANDLVTEAVEALGVHCTEILEFGVEQIVIRLVHVLASMRHLEREPHDPRVYEEVRTILTRYDRMSPGLLNIIIQEYKAKEQPHARH